MTDERIEWVVLTSHAARYMADLQIQTLESEGIPVLVRGEEAGIWGPAYAGPTSQGIKLLVPKQALAEARFLLELEDDEGTGRGDSAEG